MNSQEEAAAHTELYGELRLCRRMLLWLATITLLGGTAFAGLQTFVAKELLDTDASGAQTFVAFLPAIETVVLAAVGSIALYVGASAMAAIRFIVRNLEMIRTERDPATRE